VGVLLAFVLLAASCGKFARTTAGGTPGPTTATKVGQGIVFVTASPQPGAAKGGSSNAGSAQPFFVLHLLDQNNNRPYGIPVSFDGPVHRALTSDASGSVKLTGPQGTYSMSINKGCYPSVLVSQGVVGTIHLLVGAPTSAEVRIGWQHRFGPSGVASSDAGGDWIVGQTVHIHYDVIDRCENDLAKNASFPTFVFHPSSNVALVGSQVLASGADGRASATAKCTKPGDMQLTMVDGLNPTDHADLLGDASSYNGRPRCAAR
jgi:hypothetical protein